MYYCGKIFFMQKYLTIALLFLSFIAQAQVDAEVIEVNQQSSGQPQNLAPATGRVYFSAQYNLEHNDWGLYYYDNANSKIKFVKGFENSNISKFTVVDDILFFFDGNNGMWRSDGTEQGTYIVNPPTSLYYGTITETTSYNGKLYFAFQATQTTKTIWMTDGTDAGTQILVDFPTNQGFNATTNFFIFNNKLYFKATNATYGEEIWVSDGTAVGTILLKDINTGSASSNPSKAITHNGYFYFFANNGNNGNELWRSDGTTNGTTLFKEFASGFAGISNYKPGIAGNGYFIFAITRPTGTTSTRQLWRCDGTDAGTFSIKTISLPFGDYDQFVTFNSAIYMTSGNGNFNNQLWKTDGTVAGTVLINDYSGNGSANQIAALTAFQNYMLFNYFDYQSNTYRPYISNGTATGTGMLADVNISTGFKFCGAGNKILFTGTTSKNGRELWSTDGTSDGTSIVSDINRSRHGLHPYGSIYSSILGNEIVTIRFIDGTNNKPIITQSTHNDISLLDNASTSTAMMYYDPYSFTIPEKMYYPVGNKLVYKALANNITGWELYATDGTPIGTSILKDIAPGAAHSLSEAENLFMEYNGILFFNADDQVHGKELWRTDGTDAGTYMVKDIRIGSASSLMRQNERGGMKQYAIFNNLLYFIANDGAGDAIWRTDGTANGTIMVMPVTSNTIIIGATNTKLFFVTNQTSPTYGPDTIWSTDGTQSGTILLKTYANTSNKFDFSAIMGNEIYYNTYDNELGRGLAKSDGTLQGTVFIKSSHPSSINLIKACGEYLYIGISDSSGMSEYYSTLLRSDGTTSGTSIIHTNGTYAATGYNCIASNFYFPKAALSQNLWVSTGSGNAVGIDVNLPEDIMPITNGGLQGILGYAGGKIFLDAETDINGREIFTVELQEVQAALGLDDVTDISKMNEYYIYPNPSSNIVNIKANSTVKSYVLHSLTGQKLIEKENSDTVELGSLQPGIYLLSIEGVNGSTTVKKIVKK
jgi:ELWxxDGT repeat protein